jgi:hypothetical protein
LTAYFFTLRKSGLLIPSLTQSNYIRVYYIYSGILENPTRAPIIPPTIQAFVSVSPPS